MPSKPAVPARGWEPVIDGQALRQARIDAGLSQRELIEECAALGTAIDCGNLQRAERGLPRAMGFRKLPAIATVCGIENWTDFLTPHGKREAARRAA
jgi:hypothetical protein